MWHGRFRHSGFWFGFGFPPFGMFWAGCRPYITKEEYIEMLENYKRQLQEEIEEVEKEIERLKKEK